MKHYFVAWLEKNSTIDDENEGIDAMVEICECLKKKKLNRIRSDSGVDLNDYYNNDELLKMDKQLFVNASNLLNKLIKEIKNEDISDNHLPKNIISILSIKIYN